MGFYTPSFFYLQFFANAHKTYELNKMIRFLHEMITFDFTF